MEYNAILFDPNDNVAIVVVETKEGQTVNGIGIGEIAAKEYIPCNHKIAVRTIPENTPVTKYGHTIGLAKTTIAPGRWVHAHNIKPAKG